MEKTGLFFMIAIFLMAIVCSSSATDGDIRSGQSLQQNLIRKPRQLVIDTDGGPDDAWAIFLILSMPRSDLEVVGITCVYGNSDLENVEKNVLKILTMANATKIPVYSGSRKPLTAHSYTNSNYGQDGFGDFEFGREITTKIDRSKHAVQALIDIANECRGELMIVTLGPLTNIALAMSIDSNFANNVNQFFVVGGSVMGYGNISPGVEFNFFLDPESTSVVLNSKSRNPILLMPVEPTMKFNISMEWRLKINGRKSEIIRFLNQAEATMLNYKNWSPPNSLTAAAVILRPEIIEESIITKVSPTICGEGRGGLRVDYMEFYPDDQRNVEVILALVEDDFKRTVEQYCRDEHAE